MGAVKDEVELAALEEHLLVCGQCIDRAENTEGCTEAMRAALRRLRARKKGPGALTPIVARGRNKWLVRVFVGRDAVTGK